MKDGFISVAALTPDIRVADVDYNTRQIMEGIDRAMDDPVNPAKIVVFPELCITGYTCGDLFTQDLLLEKAREALLTVAGHTKGKKGLVFVGLPLAVDGELYNVAATLSDGKVLGFTTKTFLPNYAEFYEMRQFCPGPKKARTIQFNGEEIPFGPQLLFAAQDMEELVVSAEICEDVWSPVPPSIQAAVEGATLIVNLSASDRIIGKNAYRDDLIRGQSARLICGYINANAGSGESTTDVVFDGHNIIAENGRMLSPKEQDDNMIKTIMDLKLLLGERRKNTTFKMAQERSLTVIPFTVGIEDVTLSACEKYPFIPADQKDRLQRCRRVVDIQSKGLRQRLKHIGAREAVIGISGGLDSTLALLVTVDAFDQLGLDRKGILAVTMPCFGTSDRTYQNALKLTEVLGVSLKEVSIKDAVLQHFEDIGQDPDDHDVTYENAQARERTQVLMDLANKNNGLVIGTGDMSELALGWCTYNGDHMSMYAVNVGVPKTLVRHLIGAFGDIFENEELKAVLDDILDTPVSPELLPPKDGEIAQKTEDLVGPYELHDFFLYYMLRFGYSPVKIYRVAKAAFHDTYDDATIHKWLTTFCQRFFAQQFKRSCLPDGPKVGSVALSPRGDWRMPSDACVDLWMQELEEIRPEQK